MPLPRRRRRRSHLRSAPTHPPGRSTDVPRRRRPSCKGRVARAIPYQIFTFPPPTLNPSRVRCVEDHFVSSHLSPIRLAVCGAGLAAVAISAAAPHLFTAHIGPALSSLQGARPGWLGLAALGYAVAYSTT